MHEPQDAHPIARPPHTQSEPICPTDAARWLPRLLRLIDEQTDLAMSLDSLSQLQSRAVASSDAEAALDILAQREPIVAAMTDTAKEIEPFIAPGSAYVSSLPTAERTSVQKRAGRFQDILARVSERDAVDRAALEVMRTAVSDELASMAAGRGAIAAYEPGGRSTAPRPNFQDRRA